MGFPKHYIVFLDTSYSMQQNMYKTVKGVNSFIYRLKNQGNCYFTLFLFNKQLKHEYLMKPIDEVGLFSESRIFQYGSTALYDCLGLLLCNFQEFKNFENNLYIVTDGDDNCSFIYSKEDVDEKIYNLQKTGWNITHCDVEESEFLSIQNKIMYKVNEIDNLFENMQI